MEAAAPLPTLVWDALIVWSSESDGSGYLLTEDLQAGQELHGVKGLESVFDRTGIARRMVIPESPATSVLN